MTTAEALISSIHANPLESTPVLMLADCMDELGYFGSAQMLRYGLGFISGGGYGGYGGDGDTGGDGGHGDGGDGGDGGGDGDGGDGDDGGGDVRVYKISRGFSMEDYGLYIICSPAGYNPYVRIAWCERRDIMVDMKNCRVLKQFGSMAELADIAETGPKSNTRLLKMAKRGEGVCVGMICRWIRCNPEAWAKDCPKPE